MYQTHHNNCTWGYPSAFTHLSIPSTTFPRSEPDAKEPTKFQRQSDPANHGPRVVEVFAVRDEEVRLAWVFWVTKSNDFCAGVVC
jgi:hypothetical protein